jgi:outer membrane protein OmpA-like peptidoglycan-associated protein
MWTYHSNPHVRALARFAVGIAALVALRAPAAAGTGPGDADCDAVLDAADLCDAAAEDRDGLADQDGCPDPDNDADGLADTADNCPDEMEVINDFQDDDGCPDQAIEVQKGRILLKQRIHFAFDRAQILPRSYPLLAEIAQAVRAHPEVGVVRVEGHADETGTTRYNQKLSEERSVAVYDHLVGLGIAPARLVHLGRGETRRATAGTDQDALARNRRVEFLVEFAEVARPEDNAVRDLARLRSSMRAGLNIAMAAAPGCVPSSIAATENIRDRSPPVEAPAEARLLPWGMSLGAGGGVSAFADDAMRDVADTGGSWEVRVVLGTRERVAVEVAYHGSVQSIDTLGLDADAALLSNGAGGAVRYNLLTDPSQPYILAGAAWRRYEITNARVNTSSMNDEDDVLEVPLGVGFSHRYRSFIFDGRTVYRRVFYDDLIQTSSGHDTPVLDTWTATLLGGFEF